MGKSVDSFQEAKKMLECIKKGTKKKSKEAEKLIASSGPCSLAYARDVLKGRFKEGEEEITKSPMLSFLYAKEVIKGKWAEGEDSIKEYSFCWREYEEIIKGNKK